MMSSRPYLCSSAFSSGTSVRWPAASEETPTMCTSFSIAWRAASPGVANSGPMSTSKPRSAKAEAITFWPRGVAVLAHLGHKNARAAALVVLERLHQAPHLLHGIGHAPDLPLIDARDRLDLGPVPPPHFFERVRNLADRGLGPRGLDRQVEQVALARS